MSQDNNAKKDQTEIPVYEAYALEEGFILKLSAFEFVYSEGSQIMTIP